MSGNANIENYNLNDPITFTLGAASQNVTGDVDIQTINIAGLSATGTLDGAGGTDILQMEDGSSISGAAVSNIETLTVSAGASVSMTEAQHDAFTTINGTATNQITISTATDGFTASSAIETYVLGVANSVTLGAVGQSITGSTGNDTVILGSGTYSGTINGGNGTDTLQLADGADISGATVSNFENLTLASGATVTISVSQLAQFSGTITAPGSESVNITGDGDFTTLSNIENFSVGDDSTNTRTITISNASMNVTATSATDAVTFNIGALAYTGTVTGEGTANDTVQMSNGSNVSSATLNNIEVFSTASGGSDTVTLTAAQADGATLTATDSADDKFTITASSGDQTLNGSAGADTINAGAGADLIIPGAGTDSMTGGDDNDTFQGSASDLNGDTITDLAMGDNIKLTGVTGLSASNARFNGAGTLEIDTDATTFASPEVSLTLSNSAGNTIDILAVSDSGSDTVITFKALNSAPNPDNSR